VNLISLIFALVRKFVPVQETEYASMKMEADEWHQNIIGQNAKEENSLNAFEKFYAKYTSVWYFKLLLAVSYIFLVKYIQDFMTEDNKNDKPKIDNEEIW
jgi:hypothetical protein